MFHVGARAVLVTATDRATSFRPTFTVSVNSVKVGAVAQGRGVSLAG